MCRGYFFVPCRNTLPIRRSIFLVMFIMSKLIKVTFNKNVFRVALAELGKTQKQIAQECGVAETTITRIKKGMDVKISLALKMAKVVNKNIEDLWTSSDL